MFIVVRLNIISKQLAHARRSARCRLNTCKASRCSRFFSSFATLLMRQPSVVPIGNADVARCPAAHALSLPNRRAFAGYRRPPSDTLRSCHSRRRGSSPSSDHRRAVGPFEPSRSSKRNPAVSPARRQSACSSGGAQVASAADDPSDHQMADLPDMGARNTGL